MNPMSSQQPVESLDHSPEFQELMRENMWLRKKLRRAELNLERTEELRDRSHVLLRRVIEDLTATQGELERKNEMLADANHNLVEAMERMRELQEERDSFHAELVSCAQRTGMEELATIVLHNVANALNSVFVSLSSMETQLLESKLKGVQQVAAMLEHNQDHLGAFLEQDEKGRRLPEFMRRLSELLNQEQSNLQGELRTIKKSVDHISSIVDFQQCHGPGDKNQLERVALAELVAEAIQLSQGALNRAGIELVFERVQPVQVRVDRRKVLQILLNLISNARQSLQLVQREHPRIVIRTGPHGPDQAGITVTDNGSGIEARHLPMLFVFGFTTKENGHGYGLHGSANLAAQLGGTLSGGSEGPNQGAWFRLTIPLDCQV